MRYAGPRGQLPNTEVTPPPELPELTSNLRHKGPLFKVKHSRNIASSDTIAYRQLVATSGTGENTEQLSSG